VNTWGNVSIALFETNTSNLEAGPNYLLLCISISSELHPVSVWHFKKTLQTSDYGISLHDKKRLKVWKKNQEKVGRQFSYEENIILDNSR
jgi:hypothetical protein